MARLRIRIELSRGGAGVPLHKLASVISESQKFLNLLTEDVQIDKQRGEWMGCDFDQESLNFTAEYAGPVTTRQVEAFNAAFDGTTSLRRDTIGQFLRITEAIGEDEVIGFGLYQAENTAEPSEWRCLSRRDAWLIAEEVQILMGSGQAAHLPSVSDRGLGARMFGDRRERTLRESRLTEYVREVESGLSTRIQRVENQVQKQSGFIQDLQVQSTATDTSFRNLLTTFETFCNQATRNIEKMAPAVLASPGVSSTAAALPAPPLEAPAAAPAISVPEPTGVSQPPQHRVWMVMAGVAIATAVVAGIWLWPINAPSNANSNKQEPALPAVPSTVSAASVEAVPSRPAPVPPATLQIAPPAAAVASGPPMDVTLEATEPSWVSIKDQAGKAVFAQVLMPGPAKTFRLLGGGALRAGNAGGLVVRLNGAPIGPIGPNGGVRDVEFNDGKFTIVTP